MTAIERGTTMIGAIGTVGAFCSAYKAFHRGDIEKAVQDAFAGVVAGYLTVESLHMKTDPKRVTQAGIRAALSCIVFYGGFTFIQMMESQR